MSENSTFQPICSLIEGCWPGEWGNDPVGDNSNCVVFRATDIDNDGHLNLEGGAARYVLPLKIRTKALIRNDILLEASGGAPDKPVGRVALVASDPPRVSLTSNFFRFIRPTSGVDARFLALQLVALNRSPAIWRYQQQTTGLINLKVKDYLEHEVLVPTLPVQQKISDILFGIDRVIEKTEALIAKYQQIKAGLMHDMFTRGVTADGKLRPSREQAPELYQETHIGCIPKVWAIKNLSDVLESIVDGPFGSNLKTEHYVIDPGVRVVRLQNVAEFEYNDNDKVYIPRRHANFLLRNKVISGDVLIAGLGEERYPVGRACCYPDGIDPAINKADCFRARCNPAVMGNRFFMLILNSWMTRRQIRRYEQGVTRPRINTGNFKRLSIGIPDLDEQEQIVAKFDAVQSVINIEQGKVAKLRTQKLGLMSDLLTGKVRVKPDVNNPEMAVG